MYKNIAKQHKKYFKATMSVELYIYIEYIEEKVIFKIPQQKLLTFNTVNLTPLRLIKGISKIFQVFKYCHESTERESKKNWKKKKFIF